ELFEDWDLLIRLASMHPFHHIKTTTAHYNNWDRLSQITHASEEVKADAYFRVLKKHRDKITEEVIRNYGLVGNKRKCIAVEANRQLQQSIQQLETMQTNKEVINPLRLFLQRQKEQTRPELHRSKVMMSYLELILALVDNIERLPIEGYQAIVNEFIALIPRMTEIEQFSVNASSSVFWKLARRYYTLRDRFFPKAPRKK
ncbi:MAG: hypothetical protein HQL02_13130, partial [Nitrospirae bacterium]|nr:hypothetical protein [Nitrospirota bacterium]